MYIIYIYIFYIYVSILVGGFNPSYVGISLAAKNIKDFVEFLSKM